MVHDSSLHLVRAKYTSVVPILRHRSHFIHRANRIVGGSSMLHFATGTMRAAAFGTWLEHFSSTLTSDAIPAARERRLPSAPAFMAQLNGSVLIEGGTITVRDMLVTVPGRVAESCLTVPCKRRRPLTSRNRRNTRPMREVRTLQGREPR